MYIGIKRCYEYTEDVYAEIDSLKAE
ncbi:Protein of unknown function [Bacillus wiedmannii]|uniref:Uncharacterized protein n=1 Tax=Bacillus wiedmannii TaxID=1890302 RepID=A0A1C4EKI5_9BACI|nr:Protein of unknown function [Bacillus wiedmannii]